MFQFYAQEFPKQDVALSAGPGIYNPPGDLTHTEQQLVIEGSGILTDFPGQFTYQSDSLQIAGVEAVDGVRAGAANWQDERQAAVTPSVAVAAIDSEASAVFSGSAAPAGDRSNVGAGRQTTATIVGEVPFGGSFPRGRRFPYCGFSTTAATALRSPRARSRAAVRSTSGADRSGGGNVALWRGQPAGNRGRRRLKSAHFAGTVAAVLSFVQNSMLGAPCAGTWGRAVYHRRSDRVPDQPPPPPGPHPHRT